ncbi:contractile injection system protein, VgrG/Pvc8 family [Trinickia diaoshuihuensis]|uniref:contractile injection system protein, VgrG/Pvc8 family n=1 Tax=Trinickia diaoshuihuensis TaxID=2292265 RepID=UPI001F074EEC|nr:contractile injection system protein, VgrG/Pvc8 family [Trinickia diaoshuihuensis]
MGLNALFEAAFAGGAQRSRLIRLDTPLGEDWLLPLYAKGVSRLGRDYEFVVEAASVKGREIDLQAMIGKAVTLWLQQTDGTYLPHHGFVKTFSRLGSDGYLSFYQLSNCTTKPSASFVRACAKKSMEALSGRSASGSKAPH